MERRRLASDNSEASIDSAPTKLRSINKRPKHRSHDGGQLNLRQLWRLVKINKYVVGSAILFSVSLTGLHGFFSTPIYKASVTMTIATTEAKSLHEIIGGLGGDDELSQKTHALDEYFHSGEMTSRLTAVFQKVQGIPMAVLAQKGFQRILLNLGLTSMNPSDADRSRNKAELAGELMSMLSIQSNYVNSTMVIEAATPTPQLSAFLANEAARALVDINHKVGLKKVTEIKKFLSHQSTELGGRLQALESELSDFQAKNQIISQGEAERSIYSTLDKHESSYIDSEIRLSTNVKLISQIEKEMSGLKSNITKSDFTGSNLYLSQLQHRLSMLQYQQAMTQSSDGPVDNKKELQQEINGLVTSYKKALENRDAADNVAYMNPLEYYQSLEQSLAVLKKDNERFGADLSVLKSAITKHKGEFPKLASNLQHLTELKRNVQLTSDLYLAIRKKLQEAEIQEAGTINDIGILTEASIPSAPHAVGISFKIMFASAIGLFFGVLFVLTHEAIVPCVRHRHDIEQNGIYVLGEIPLADPVPGVRSLIPINDSPNSYEADAFRFVRMRLSSYTKHKPGQEATMILVTSPRSANGKTFTSVNLAMTLSKSKLKTLLIDMDLRKPSTQRYFDPSSKSIESVAKNPKNPDYAQAITTINPNLDVMFGTQHINHPPEFLESDALPAMFAHLRKQYDFIIIDSAPILGIIDSSIVARMVDHVLFVVEHRKTLREDLAMALHTLREVHHKPLLGVLNCVHKEFGYYDNKYYVVRSGQLQTQDLG